MVVSTAVITAWLVQVVSLATGAAAIITALGLLDKALNGRVRELLRRWLAIKQTYDMAESNGEKLDRLHEDHMETMGAQVAVAEHTQQLSEIVCNEHDIPDRRRPFDLPIDELKRRANDRGAAWPGDFKRGD